MINEITKEHHHLQYAEGDTVDEIGAHMTVSGVHEGWSFLIKY